MKMIISGVSESEGKKRAFVRFEEGEIFAEGIIPDCRITKNSGFTDDEVKQLEDYLFNNLEMLKRNAAANNPIRAMMKDDRSL